MRSACVSHTGATLAIDNHLIDIPSMSLQVSLPGNARILAMTPSADILLAKDEDAWDDKELTIYRRSGDHYTAGKAIATGCEGIIAMHPDGSSFARVNDDGLHLFDLRQGSLSQRINGSFESVSFRSDGQVIAGFDDNRDRIRLLHADGTDETIGSDVRGFAFSPDGRTAAVLENRAVRIGSLDELRAKRGKKIRAGDYSWRLPCFSPDGQWFAVIDYSADKVLVIDVAAGRVALKLGNPGQPRGRVGSPRTLGFSADSARLLVGCDVHYNRFDNEDEDCVAIWSLPDGVYLGALLASEDNRKPVAVAADGFYGFLPHTSAVDADPAHRRQSSKRGSSKSPWQRPEVARRALLGEPIDEHLDELARAQLADLEAHDAQSKMQTFGGGKRDAAPLTGDQLLNAAEALRQRPAAELDLLHQELIAEAEHREQEQARELAGRSPQAARARLPESDADGASSLVRSSGAGHLPAVRQAQAVSSRSTAIVVGAGVAAMLLILGAISALILL